MTGSRVLVSANRWFAIVLTLVALGGPAFAQPAYPSKLIRIVIPFPAGGLVDGVARLLQPSLEKALGQSIVLDNRPAASGTVGTDQIAKASPDGYNLLMVASTHTVAPAVNPKLPYDIERDLSPVAIIAKNPLMFVASNETPAKTLGEFVALAKAQPEKLTYATPGAASQSHLVTELFMQRAGIKMLHVPYRGGAPAMVSLVRNETQFTVISTQLSAPQVEAGAIRALAAGGRTRDKQFPNTPTLIESGFPDFEAVQWVGLLAPPNTPPEIVGKLNAEVNRLLSEPDVVARLATQGMSPAGGTPADFAKVISAELKEWTDVARRAQIAAP